MALFKRRNDEVPAELVAQATPLHEAMQAAQEPARFKRPGDSPAVPYIGNTRENLTKIVDKYHAEARALEADIARLIEEQRQLRVAIHSLEIAIGVINENDTPLHAMGSADDDEV